MSNLGREMMASLWRRLQAEGAFDFVVAVKEKTNKKMYINVIYIFLYFYIYLFIYFL